MRNSQDCGLMAARKGRSIRRYVSEVSITGSFVVQTSATLYYDIPVGKQIVVCRLFVGCETALNLIEGYLVGCSAVAGGGDAVQMNNHIHDHVGDKKEGSGHIVRDTCPKIVLKYSEGYRSVSIAVKATDTNTVVSFGWNGWIEDEGTFS